MLRNSNNSKQLIRHIFCISQQQQHQQRFIQQVTVLYSKNANVSRQGKIMGKLFGERVSGSKKRWYPSATDSRIGDNSHLQFKQSNFGGKTPSGGGKNANRRLAVLNKLFMEHITDLMATGEISETILGKGLQISSVKVSQDFANVLVYWVATGDEEKDSILNKELQHCSGLLRHELSQLGLMGVVPRIQFAKDRYYKNMYQVENLIKNMNLESCNEMELVEANLHNDSILKQDFYGNQKAKLKQVEFPDDERTSLNDGQLLLPCVPLPEMRHDVLGLDHKAIMIKILTKMRKSKQAWDQHLQNSSLQSKNADCSENGTAMPPLISFNKLAKANERLAKVAANSEKFEAFLAKRREKRDTPERKKFRAADHPLPDVKVDDEYDERALSTRQRQLYDAEDYLCDDLEDKKT